MLEKQTVGRFFFTFCFEKGPAENSEREEKKRLSERASK